MTWVDVLLLATAPLWLPFVAALAAVVVGTVLLTFAAVVWAAVAFFEGIRPEHEKP